MDTVVIDRSRESDNSTNIMFLQYLCQGNLPLISAEAFECYTRAEAKDLENTRSASNKHLRNATKQSLELCKTYESCPILLKELTFDTFSKYLVSKRNNKTSSYLSITYYECWSEGVARLISHLFESIVPRAAGLTLKKNCYKSSVAQLLVLIFSVVI